MGENSLSTTVEQVDWFVFGAASYRRRGGSIAVMKRILCARVAEGLLCSEYVEGGRNHNVS